jgi:hypothetical protein
MTGTIGYTQPFRAIGQALETLNLKNFELEPTGEDFLVRGHLPKPLIDVTADALSPASLNTVWGNLAPSSSANRSEQNEALVPLLSSIELQYTSKDIDRLEREGRANRADPNRIPEHSSLSQVLRCVGRAGLSWTLSLVRSISLAFSASSPALLVLVLMLSAISSRVETRSYLPVTCSTLRQPTVSYRSLVSRLTWSMVCLMLAYARSEQSSQRSPVYGFPLPIHHSLWVVW